MIVNVKDLKLTEKNYNEIINLYNGFTLIDSLELTFSKLKKIISQLPIKHNIYFYMIDDKIVGAITLIIEQKIIHNGRCSGHIEDFVVLEEYRSQGIGGLLVNYAINISKENNCYKCILDCHESLENYYMKKGFVKKGIYMGNYFK
jgi:glucosamine-phosphate N-acetyltransferase|tara:strand:+ start:37 stop:474 length:438 start_codon:yes stop_codon:yes gene_type:complete